MDVQCIDGARGPLCSSCSIGFAFSNAQNKCEPCDAASSSSYIVFGVMLFISLFLIISYYALEKREGSSLVSQFIASVDPGSLKVLWVTYQIIYLFSEYSVP